MLSPSITRRAALACSLLASACTVGPDYTRPPTVATGAEGGAAYHRIGDLPTEPLSADPRWWRALGDPQLDGLIEQALQSSPTIAIAQARLRQSRASLREQQSNLLPQGNASASYLRYRLPLGNLTGGDEAAGEGGAESAQSSDPAEGGLWSATFDATWEIDLFGAKRRQRDAARARAEASEAQLADAQISLAGEVAQAYIDLRDQQQRLILVNRSSELQNQLLSLVEQRFRQGAAAREDVERLRTQVSQTRSLALPLSTQADQSLNRLAVLIGREPGFLDAQLSTPGPVPQAPGRVPIDEPAAMLRRRPDIRAAEREIAASSEQIGINTAQLFPSLSLLGLVGMAGPSISALDFDDLSAVGTPMLRWSFLDFGRTRARIRQSEAQRDEALAQYQQTVLQALQSTEDALSQYRGFRGTLTSRQESEQAATVSAEMVRQRYARGAASLIDLLDSQRQRIDAEQQVAQARAQVANGYVAVVKSLGLGWQPTAPQSGAE